uniref:Uncharacterized protein n=1 Tax=Arundo donax TaxID=35708 RepID=A0A0A9CY21_ARUDO
MQLVHRGNQGDLLILGTSLELAPLKQADPPETRSFLQKSNHRNSHPQCLSMPKMHSPLSSAAVTNQQRNSLPVAISSPPAHADPTAPATLGPRLASFKRWRRTLAGGAAPKAMRRHCSDEPRRGARQRKMARSDAWRCRPVWRGVGRRGPTRREAGQRRAAGRSAQRKLARGPAR